MKSLTIAAFRRGVLVLAPTFGALAFYLAGDSWLLGLAAGSLIPAGLFLWLWVLSWLGWRNPLGSSPKAQISMGAIGCTVTVVLLLVGLLYFAAWTLL